MAGNTFGKQFRITTWGESHGKAIGVVVDGVPAELPISESDIQAFLDRRKPGSTRYSTPRKEADAVQILSGVFEGRATGTPISLLIPNTSQRSSDYSEIASYYRPGHADYTYDMKYGFRDYRGGGRSSGRETAGRVAAGAIASLFLKQLGIRVCAYTRSIGPISCEDFCQEEISRNPLCMPDADAAARAQDYLDACMKQFDSSGGVVECFADGVPAGLGDPVFDKLDAALAGAVMSIGAVKAVEIGDGTAVSRARGSENNDPFRMRDGHVEKETNHAGGILGGISDGSRILLRAHIKPTASIFSDQQTVNRNGENITIRIKGRHDPVIVPRAVVVVESMTSLVLADALLSNMTARLDRIREFYKV
ncbi:MAG TPA: chorismate synthase [Candidatus Eisenbergiella merdipullorum]|uniref:Chorismate synthase n=1 Tax=Candidatus Eisenbergiella merdipullorum TaxID=2838553 RepID=A0A9D2KZB7_9FIRM|nr:chorismate synthase [Candidatus Eisenbergiella merdipullorum]